MIHLISAYVWCSTFLLIGASGDGICSKGINVDGPPECCANFYNVGNGCRECPPGYYGKNCSNPCPTPEYGMSCNYRCDNCSNCNHIYGCGDATEAETNTVDHFMSPGSTVKVTENATYEGNGNETSEFHINVIYTAIVITSGTLISLVILLIVIGEICRYKRSSGLRDANKVSCRTHEVDETYTEINEFMVNVALPEDNESTGSNKCISNGHPPFTEIEETACEEYVYSTVCKEKILSEDKIRPQFNVNSVQNSKEKNNQESDFDLQSNTSSVNCFGLKYLSDSFDILYADDVFVNEKTESTYF
ncbi:uncharacterized protein LOC130048199 [Ostrea edulis]|uniref:uncharacterized protein LOC130048199 n=1 Tax=Ostrea edulis TaxID=37623 RepID=UPI0024AED007|nr:uncharacterized protein LOC130048199 [Ostrea edulis]